MQKNILYQQLNVSHNILNMKINFYSIALFFIVALSFNFIYLIPSDFLGNISLNDLNLVFIIFTFLFVIIRYPTSLFCSSLKMFYIIEAIYILLMCTSSYEASIAYHQPFWLGFRAQRNFLIYPLVFATYYILYKKNKITEKGILYPFYVFSVLEMILGLVQVMVGPDYRFLNVTILSRYGMNRAFMEISIPIFLSFISLRNVIYKKNIFRNIIYQILVISFLMLVTQWRLPLIMYVVSMVIIIIFNFKTTSLRKVVFLLAFVICLFLFFQTKMGSDILDITINKSQNSTSEIREQGRFFYESVLKESPILGWGFVNTQWPEAMDKSMFNNNIFAVDNGVFGYTFLYGYLGSVLIILLNLYLLIKSIINYRKHNSICITGYVLYSFFSCYTVFMFGMSDTMIIPLVMLMYIIDSNDCGGDLNEKSVLFNRNI